MHTCQMTIGWDAFPGAGFRSYGKCNRPAKYRNPRPSMGVEFICGVHARSLDTMYKRTGQNLKCVPLAKEEQI
jgi:hypothetical protein